MCILIRMPRMGNAEGGIVWLLSLLSKMPRTGSWKALESALRRGFHWSLQISPSFGMSDINICSDLAIVSPPWGRRDHREVGKTGD